MTEPTAVVKAAKAVVTMEVLMATVVTWVEAMRVAAKAVVLVVVAEVAVAMRAARVVVAKAVDALYCIHPEGRGASMLQVAFQCNEYQRTALDTAHAGYRSYRRLCSESGRLSQCSCHPEPRTRMDTTRRAPQQNHRMQASCNTLGKRGAGAVSAIGNWNNRCTGSC